MARTYNTVGWRDGTVLQPAKVTIQGVDYEVQPQVISGTTPVNSNNLKHMDNEIKKIVEEDIPGVLGVSLIAVSDTAPDSFSTGDKYYNTVSDKIFTAEDSTTWDDGVTPTEGIVYIVFDSQNIYMYNGETLVSVGGGGGSSIVVEPDEPTEDTKLYIESEDLDFQGLEIANEYNTADNMAYSCDYVNDSNSYSTSEVKTNKRWIDGKPIYRKVFTGSNFTNGQTMVSNVSSFVDAYGLGDPGTGTTRQIPYYEFYNSNSYMCRFYKSGSNIILESQLGGVGHTAILNCTIEYTKTTD